MNDDELRQLLEAADQPVEVPPELSRDVQREMIEELRSATGGSTHNAKVVDGGFDVRVEPTPTEIDRRNHNRMLVAAAIILAVGLGALFAIWRPLEDEPTDVATNTPSYLLVCAEFQQSTRTESSTWEGVLRDMEDSEAADSQEYLDGLRRSLAEVGQHPTTAKFGDEFRGIDELFDRPAAIPDELLQALLDLKTLLREQTPADCL